MIRLFQHHARFLLLMLVAWKHRVDSNGTNNHTRDLVGDVSAWSSANPTHPITIWLSSFDWVDTIEHADVDEQMGALIEGFGDRSADSKGDVSIISTIIDLLGLPWTGNRIGTETLTALRRAILRPSEITNFQRIAKESFQCAACAHKFMGNEAGIVHRGSNNELVVYCIRCAAPTHGACASCGETAPISSAGITALASTKFVSCGCTSTKGKKKDPVMSVSSSANSIPTLAQAGLVVMPPSNFERLAFSARRSQRTQMVEAQQALRRTIPRSVPPTDGLLANQLTWAPSILEEFDPSSERAPE